MEFRLLRADEIDCRISTCSEKGVSILLYKDARCDMNILDETVGVERWQRSHEVINGNLFCNVGISFPTDSGFDKWIWKQDVGTESYTEKEKGEASDSFKRACFNWGIGRELYTAPFMWVNAKDLSTLKQEGNKWTCRDSFKVTRIEYVDKKIVCVEIQNLKTKTLIEFGTPAKEVKKTEDVANTPIDEAKKNVLLETMKAKGVGFLQIAERYKLNSIDEMTVDTWMKAMSALKKMKDV